MEDKYYTDIVASVVRSFERRTKKQEEVWEGFQDEKENLESYLTGMFSDLIHNLNLQTTIQDQGERKVPIQIYEWKTDYHPRSRKTQIDVLKWGIVRIGGPEMGGIPGGPCAYMALENLVGFTKDPLVKEFEETYNARILTNCNCGSDHK